MVLHLMTMKMISSKQMEQYALQYCPQLGARKMQLRAMTSRGFLYKKGSNVTEHMARYRAPSIIKYTILLPGERDELSELD